MTTYHANKSHPFYQEFLTDFKIHSRPPKTARFIMRNLSKVIKPTDIIDRGYRNSKSKYNSKN